MWWLLLLSLSAFAQEDIDLSALRELDDELSDYALERTTEDTLENERSKMRPLNRVVKMETILKSGTEDGSIRKKAVLMRISDNKKFVASKDLFVKYFRREDEHGFKYLLNKDGTCTFRILGEKVEPIKNELALYVPPLRYTPAPPVMKSEYDKKLNIHPEFIFMTGLVQGDYMADLLNDSEAKSGSTNQFAFQLFTEWKLSFKVGLVANYERSRYSLSNGGDIQFTNVSFGPLFRSRDFEFIIPLRAQVQFRVSPFARAEAFTSQGDVEFKFNSADLLLSVDHPFKNTWGEFTLGLFFENQWLNIKDQPQNVSLNASNETNKLFGLTLSQVFQ